MVSDRREAAVALSHLRALLAGAISAAAAVVVTAWHPGFLGALQAGVTSGTITAQFLLLEARLRRSGLDYTVRVKVAAGLFVFGPLAALIGWFTTIAASAGGVLPLLSERQPVHALEELELAAAVAFPIALFGGSVPYSAAQLPFFMARVGWRDRSFALTVHAFTSLSLVAALAVVTWLADQPPYTAGRPSQGCWTILTNSSLFLGWLLAPAIVVTLLEARPVRRAALGFVLGSCAGTT